MSSSFDWQQAIGFLLFVSVVVSVLLGSAFIILNRVWQRQVDKRNGNESKPLPLFQKLVLVSGAIGLTCVLYGALVEPYMLTTSRLTIETDKLAGSDHLRVVHISDLHCDPLKRLEGKLPAAIAAEKPDLICFTGDCINSPEGLSNFKSCMKQLSAIAPTYGVRGNWDAWYWKKIDLFGETGAIELKGKPSEQTVRGTSVWIGGEAIDGAARVKEIMANVPEKSIRIFLFHFPEYIEEMRSANIDLYLAGHTHGGQIALPIYGAIVTLSSAGKRFEAGHYRSGDTHLYVNRGIGMEGGKTPRVRFCAPPEITVIDFVGRKKR